MRVNFFVLIVTFTLLFGGVRPAQAVYMDGKVLLGLCQSARETEQFICDSYISGMLDYYTLVQSLDTAPPVQFCLPKKIKIEEIRAIVTTYLSNNRQHDSFGAASAVTLALFEKYPCPKKPKRIKGW